MIYAVTKAMDFIDAAYFVAVGIVPAILFVALLAAIPFLIWRRRKG